MKKDEFLGFAVDAGLAVLLIKQQPKSISNLAISFTSNIQTEIFTPIFLKLGLRKVRSVKKMEGSGWILKFPVQKTMF